MKRTKLNGRHDRQTDPDHFAAINSPTSISDTAYHSKSLFNVSEYQTNGLERKVLEKKMKVFHLFSWCLDVVDIRALYIYSVIESLFTSYVLYLACINDKQNEKKIA